MKLEWSELATHDLAGIRDFSIDRWGGRTARSYVKQVRDAARSVAANPRRARSLRPPLHILRVGSHYLIVHIDNVQDRLTVARVLHSAMDIERHLS